jgi:hypothetical protein
MDQAVISALRAMGELCYPTALLSFAYEEQIVLGDSVRVVALFSPSFLPKRLCCRCLFDMMSVPLPLLFLSSPRHPFLYLRTSSVVSRVRFSPLRHGEQE